ncbi:MAG: class II aldolase/adducin family protein [Sedimentitalea sp.]
MNKSTSHAETMQNATSMTLPAPEDLPTLKGKVSDEEWRLRCELAATYRLVALYGWEDMIFTHISVRLPDEEGKARFLMNPYGLLFDEITATSLIKVDMEGQLIGETPYFSNPAGFTIHSALHMGRSDAHCVLHLHTPYGVAVSVQQGGLKRYTQFSMVVNDDVAYHDYEGIATDLDERDRLVADIGAHNYMMLKNHGTLTVGHDCASAFLRMYFLEQACKTQILAQSDTVAPTEQPAEMSAKVHAQAEAGMAPDLAPRLAWSALMRRLHRVNPGYDV